MNKILLATTALVATAGFAAADVTLSGSAEMGLADSGNGVEFFHDLDVRFTLSGETDGGLTFGATIDLDEIVATDGGVVQDKGTDIPTDNGPHAVFISGGFGTLTLGDTDGAMDWAMTEVAIGSSIADDHTVHAGYNGNSKMDGSSDGQILRYDNTFGDFGVAVSAELDDDDSNSGDTYGLGVKYNAALGGLDLGLGLGYQKNDDHAAVGLSVATTFANGLQAIINYSDLDGVAATDNDSHMGLGLGYTSGALTVSANYGEYETVGGDKADGFGVAVNYDLGGAAVQFGYGDGTKADGTEKDTWSLGLAMSF